MPLGKCVLWVVSAYKERNNDLSSAFFFTCAERSYVPLFFRMLLIPLIDRYTVRRTIKRSSQGFKKSVKIRNRKIELLFSEGVVFCATYLSSKLKAF